MPLKILLAAAMLAAFFSPSALAADADALAADLMERNNAMIARLKEQKTASGALDSDATFRIIQQHMSAAFNFQKLTQRAMGKHWRRTDADMRRSLTLAFRLLLENTYAKVLTQYSDQQVKLLKAAALPSGNISVLMEIVGAGKSAQIEYLLSPGDDGKHRITDVKVEKISLLTNYRRQFARTIKKSGVEGLLTELEELANAKKQ